MRYLPEKSQNNSSTLDLQEALWNINKFQDEIKFDFLIKTQYDSLQNIAYATELY